MTAYQQTLSALYDSDEFLKFTNSSLAPWPIEHPMRLGLTSSAAHEVARSAYLSSIFDR